MAGRLYLCATPIGNLEDITFRVLKTLKEVDLIAAEDTRNSIKLLSHFDIHTPMTSYHEHNKIEKGKILIRKMLDGADIALITDAGTPGISDPGEELVKMSYEAGIEVTSLPGACAAVTALVMSAQSTGRFCFEAFLPPDKKERARIFAELKEETRTIVLYEAPHRLRKTLEELFRELGDRKLTLLRELTKKHETATLTTLLAAIAQYETQEAKGEYVLIVEGADPKKCQAAEQESFRNIPLSEHMAHYQSEGLSKKEAMKAVARDRGMSKREIYEMLLETPS